MGLQYLPEVPKETIESLIYEKCTAKLDAKLQEQSYDRIGLDRVYLILSDIYENYGASVPYSFLDVGCNNGLIADFISGYGNYVYGIDNYAINRQKRYDDLNFSQNALATFEQIDIYDFLQKRDMRFDFVLLLSVAHQWEYGYAHSGELTKDDSRISYIMNTLLQRTTKAIYYECPINEPGFDKDYGIKFLNKYLEDYANLSIVKIADTVASSGYMRALYRISRITSAMESNDNYNALQDLMVCHNLSGDIVVNGSKGKTKYALYCGDSLIVSMEGNEREESHPLGKQPICKNRYELWQKIYENQPTNVVKIENLYKEGFAKIEIVKGVPSMILPTTPTWQIRRQLIKEGDTNITFATISQLCFGLGELHKLGIAHGDPYPYNAIIGEEVSKWVDLGNVSIGEDEIIKDIEVFFVYTFCYLLQTSNKISYQMLDNLRSLFETTSRLEMLLLEASEIIGREYTDVRTIVDGDCSFLFETVEHILEAQMKKHLAYLPYYQAYKYHMDFIEWMKTANNYATRNEFLVLAAKYSQMENSRMRISKDVLTIESSNISQRYETGRAEIQRQYVVQMEKMQQEYLAERDRIIEIANEKVVGYANLLNATNTELKEDNEKLRAKISSLEHMISELNVKIEQYSEKMRLYSSLIEI